VLTFIRRKPDHGYHGYHGYHGHSGQRGVTLIELMVTVTLLSILLGLAVPNFRTWINNAKVRTVSDGLQTGLRLAQAEAVRRNRQVVFFLTNSSDCTGAIAADANGMHWSIRTVALMAGEPIAVVQCGVVADSAGGVAITGPTAVCFNSMGRQTANATPGVTGATCALNAVTGMSTFNLAATGGDRPLRVLVTLGGQSRMCDPARTLSDTTPDGCP
jgi:type IV fimbrial biogenesis protein FimT